MKKLIRTSFRRLPKFTIGKTLTKPQQVLDACASGKWLFFGRPPHRRAYHPWWIANMNFTCVMNYVKLGQLALTVRNSEYPYVFKATLMEAAPGVEVSSEWWAKCSEIPSCNITAFTKDAVIKECQAQAEAVGGPKVRVQVSFQVPAKVETPSAVRKIQDEEWAKIAGGGT